MDITALRKDLEEIYEATKELDFVVHDFLSSAGQHANDRKLVNFTSLLQLCSNRITDTVGSLLEEVTEVEAANDRLGTLKRPRLQSGDSRSAFPLHKLSGDLLSLVFQVFDQRIRLMSLSFVCKQWRSIIRKTVTHAKIPVDCFIQQTLLDAYPHVCSLEITHTCGTGIIDLPTLTHLSINIRRKEKFCTVRLPTRLLSLELYGDACAGVLLACNSVTTSLTHFGLFGVNLSTLVARSIFDMPRLSSLALLCSKQTSSVELPTQLQRLWLHRCHLQIQSSTSFPCLQEMRVGQVDARDILFILEKAPLLRVLERATDAPHGAHPCIETPARYPRLRSIDPCIFTRDHLNPDPRLEVGADSISSADELARTLIMSGSRLTSVCVACTMGPSSLLHKLELPLLETLVFDSRRLQQKSVFITIERFIIAAPRLRDIYWILGEDQIRPKAAAALLGQAAIEHAKFTTLRVVFYTEEGRGNRVTDEVFLRAFAQGLIVPSFGRMSEWIYGPLKGAHHRHELPSAK